VANASGFDKAPPSGVAQTANVGRTHSMTGSAAKVFREFKWGLLTLFLLMVVVVGLVYDGGRKKKGEAEKSKAVAELAPEISLDGDSAPPLPPPDASGSVPAPAPMPSPGAPVDVHVPQPPVPLPDPNHNIVESPGPAIQPLPHAPSRPQPGEVIQSEPRFTTVVPPKPAEPETTGKTYTVKPGDTLTRIASTLKLGKGGTKALVDANKDVLSNPDKLKVGMTLKVPTVAPEQPKKKVAEMSIDAATPKDAVKKESVVGKAPSKEEYVVQTGDTLERIARKLFNDGRRWRDIYEWNRDQLSDPGRLKLGQSLRIKTTDALPVAPKSSSARAEQDETKVEPKKNTRVAAGEPQIEESQVEVMSQPVRFSDVP